MNEALKMRAEVFLAESLARSELDGILTRILGRSNFDAARKLRASVSIAPRREQPWAALVSDVFTHADQDKQCALTIVEAAVFDLRDATRTALFILAGHLFDTLPDELREKRCSINVVFLEENSAGCLCWIASAGLDPSSGRRCVAVDDINPRFAYMACGFTVDTDPPLDRPEIFN